MIGGALLAVVALLRLINFCQILRWQFSFPTLVGVAVFGFAAAMFLMGRRDKMLLIALGVLAGNQLIWGNMIDFVAAVMLLLIALVMTTEYLPQAKALAEKIWFVPAILTFIASIVGMFSGMRYGYISLLSVIWFLAELGAMLLCAFWLAFPERDITELFAAAKAKAGAVAAAAGENTVAEAAVDGYCDIFKQVLLMMLTFGVWYFVWIYRVTAYLNRVEGKPQRNPVGKLLLCMFVPFYLYYWIYKSAGLIDTLGEQTGVRSKLAAPCLILSLVAGFVPFILMQAKINEIITFEHSEVVAPAELPAAEEYEECDAN